MVREFALHFSQSATHIQVPHKKQLEGLHLVCLGEYRTILISVILIEALSDCKFTKETIKITGHLRHIKTHEKC